MRARFDFTAPAGTHFGIVKTLEERLAEIPNAIDYWDALPARYTLANGRVSEWTGARGRRLTQASATLRPLGGANELAFFDATTDAAAALLSLSGTQIGQTSNLTLAFKGRIKDSAMTRDAQFVLGANSAANRLAYRYNSTSARYYLRSTIGATNIDVDLPPGFSGSFGAVITVSPTEACLYVPGMPQGRAALTTGADFSNLIVGASTLAGGSLAGWVSRFGAWSRAATADEINTLLAWVR